MTVRGTTGAGMIAAMTAAAGTAAGAIGGVGTGATQASVDVLGIAVIVGAAVL